MTINLPLKLPQRFSAWFPFSLSFPQLEVGKRIFDTNENILVIAPTGTGKTAIGELAIVKELINRGETEIKGPVAIFLVPLKAITSERIRIWEQRQGIKAVVVTAETTMTFDDILESDIIISVPEKIDSITRNPELEIEPFLDSIRVLVLDEVHLLDMDGRGDALEALVTRFFRKSKEKDRTRIIALSATVPNYEDVAAWLQVPSSGIFRYGEEFRPITLETRFLTYQEGESFEEDRQTQNDLVLEQIETALERNYQVIVFVNSRKGTEKLAKRIVHFWDKNGTHGDLVSAETLELSDKVESKSLSKVIFAGVGFHHAGLSQKDRELIETKFIEGFCRILASTTTLAWGVNLPVDLVVIRDVEIYDSLKGRMLIGAIDIQQMLGRAGRPGYSRGVGFGAVIVSQEKLSAIKKRISGDTEIKSRFSESLKEHLLAEIVRGTILNREDAFDWLEHTYYFLRLKSTESDPSALIKEIIEDALKYLLSSGFISSLEGELQSSALGRLSTRFYLRLETAKRFSSYLNTEETYSFIILILLLASAEEFERVAIRKEEISFIEELDSFISQETAKKVPTLNMGQKKIARMILALVFRQSDLLRSETAIYSTTLRIASFLKELSEFLFGATLMPILELFNSLRGEKRLTSTDGFSIRKGFVSIDLKGFPNMLNVGERCYGLIIIRELLLNDRNMEISIYLSNNLAFNGKISLKENKWSFPLLLQALPNSSSVSCRIEVYDSETKEALATAEKDIRINN